MKHIWITRYTDYSSARLKFQIAEQRELTTAVRRIYSSLIGLGHTITKHDRKIQLEALEFRKEHKRLVT